MYNRNHLLRIVQDNALEAISVSFLIVAQGGVEAVQAVRFGGRPGVVVDHDPDTRIRACSGHGRCDCFGIVGIATDVESEVILPPDRQRMTHGMTDHVRFTPRGDQNGGTPGEWCSSFFTRDPINLCTTGQLQPYPAQIDTDIIGGTKQEPERCEQQKFLFNKLKRMNCILNRKGRRHNAPFPYLYGNSSQSAESDCIF